ncbi:hypothetical protein C2G38_2084617, partial [Gigaspora rosea]
NLQDLLQNFRNEIVKEMCNLYNEETLKYKNSESILETCYRFGKWVEKDEHKAFNYYQKLAEMNNSHGILFLGVCYTNGIRVEKNK